MADTKYGKYIVTQLKTNIAEASWTNPVQAARKGHGGDLPPIAVPPVRSKHHSLSPQEQVVGNRASYVVGCDYTPVSIVQSRLSLLSAS